MTRRARSNEDALRSDPTRGSAAGAGHRRAVVQQHQQPAPRRSSGSRATCATTTCSATRRPTPLRRQVPERSRSRSSVPASPSPRERVLRRARPRRHGGQRLGARRSRPRAEAGAERLSRPRRRAALPERGRPGLVPVVVEVKTAPLTFQPATDGKTYTSDFTVLVRFLDEQNQVARKVSQHYEITGDSRRSSARNRARSSSIASPSCRRRLLDGDGRPRRAVREVERSLRHRRSAEPGPRHAAHEQPGARQARREGPEKDRRPTIRCSSTASRSPNLGDPVSKAAKEATFYFAMYPAQGGRGPDVDDRAAAERQAGGAAADAGPARRRERPHPAAGRLPIDQLAPGTYELRAIAKQGDQQIAVNAAPDRRVTERTPNQCRGRAAIVAATLVARRSGRRPVRSPSCQAAQGRIRAYTSAATAILVDVVVRDRRGGPSPISPRTSRSPRTASLRRSTRSPACRAAAASASGWRGRPDRRPRR